MDKRAEFWSEDALGRILAHMDKVRAQWPKLESMADWSLPEMPPSMPSFQEVHMTRRRLEEFRAQNATLLDFACIVTGQPPEKLNFGHLFFWVLSRWEEAREERIETEPTCVACDGPRYIDGVVCAGCAERCRAEKKTPRDLRRESGLEPAAETKPPPEEPK